MTSLIMILKRTFQIRFSKAIDVYFSFFESKLMRTVPYSHVERIPFKIIKSFGFFGIAKYRTLLTCPESIFFCVCTQCYPWWTLVFFFFFAFILKSSMMLRFGPLDRCDPNFSLVYDWLRIQVVKGILYLTLSHSTFVFSVTCSYDQLC